MNAHRVRESSGLQEAGRNAGARRSPRRGVWRLLAVIAGVLGLAVIAVAIFSRQVYGRYRTEVEDALARYPQTSSGLLIEADTVNLPAPVQRYLAYTGAIGQPKVSNFRVEMDGRLRNDDQSAWMETKSVQYNFVENPVRMYYLAARMAGLPVYGLHAYKDGQGSMQVKVLGALPVVNQKGPEASVSDTVTLLNDMFLMAPATLIDPRLIWEEVDEHTVRVTFANGEHVVHALVYFDAEGALRNFVSEDRYREFTRATWSTPIHEYQQYGEMRLPARASAIWQLDNREFSYAEFEIEAVDYNLATFY